MSAEGPETRRRDEDEPDGAESHARLPLTRPPPPRPPPRTPGPSLPHRAAPTRETGRAVRRSRSDSPCLLGARTLGRRERTGWFRGARARGFAGGPRTWEGIAARASRASGRRPKGFQRFFRAYFSGDSTGSWRRRFPTKRRQGVKELQIITRGLLWRLPIF